MQLTPILPTLLAIVSIGAGPVLGRSTKVRDTRQTDYYVCDFRVFGETGCFEKNWGVGTLTESDLDKCYIFYDPGIQAVNLTNIIDGCSFHVYTDLSCGGDTLSIQPGQKCGGNILEEGQAWQSYKATCP